MDCREIRDQLLLGKKPSGAEAEAHARACPSCLLLMANEGSLARSLAAPPDPEGPEAERTLQSLERSIEAERGVLGWLRSRPGWLRHVATAASAVPLALSFFLRSGLRPDHAYYPLGRMLAVLAAFAGFALWLIGTATRPLHRRQPSPRAVGLAVFLGIIVAVGIALLPPPEIPDPHALPGDPVPQAWRCHAVGLLLGAPVLLVALLLRRHATLNGALLFATAAGLVANFLLQLDCCAVDRSHLLSGHASLCITFILLVLGGAWVHSMLGPRDGSER
ncbi:hypothetical protein HY251_19330 [bacterium]|nr:hypothetical protein [bacterium]